MSSSNVSAYIPCFNNAPTVLAALDSIRRQSVAVPEVFVVDDGSTDDSAALLEKADVRVIRMGRNMGRGAVRSRAMTESSGEIVLCCDATNVLEPRFLEKALHWFDDTGVGAVFGRISQGRNGGVVHRWRGRHLFKTDVPRTVDRNSTLITYGTLLRKSAVMAAGNFDPSLRHSEDAELGVRMSRLGYAIVADPSLEVLCNTDNTLSQVLERYWRWHAGREEGFGPVDYLKSMWFSARTLAVCDLRKGDPLAACISLLVPHYQFWRVLSRKFCP
ncbi:MAG TPA: glycosyltransferase family 2 protein [Roseimicrobium sp.]|nr:glycosyltransferase family 2 protein [Roseimicrobium sp.]